MRCSLGVVHHIPFLCLPSLFFLRWLILLSLLSVSWHTTSSCSFSSSQQYLCSRLSPWCAIFPSLACLPSTSFPCPLSDFNLSLFHGSYSRLLPHLHSNACTLRSPQCILFISAASLPSTNPSCLHTPLSQPFTASSSFGWLRKLKLFLFNAVIILFYGFLRDTPCCLTWLPFLLLILPALHYAPCPSHPCL